MSDIVDINDLRESYNNKMKKEELQDFAKAQHKAIIEAAKKISILQEKNQHLEQLLQEMATSTTGLQILPPEEAICLQQIRILETKSQTRELTPEETRKFDIFVKNLKLIREGNTLTVKAEKTEDIKEDQLVAIARGQGSSKG